MRRTFNRREKNALHLAADGKCQVCGVELGADWEADHVVPFSKGGETTIENGQALCKACNRSKQDKLTQGDTVGNTITLRPFQERFVDTALRKAKGKQHRNDDDVIADIVADVHPGSGKTIACLAAADRLMAEGFINQVVVFVPRLNLAAQFEQDWLTVRDKLPWPRTMRYIFHRPNVLPLLLQEADGYISTYDSLMSNPKIHLQQIASRRTLVIFDEAQQLGVDYDGKKTTQSAQTAIEIGKRAQMLFVMSGTPTRADGSPILFAQYSNTANNEGVFILEPDVSSTYRDGVRDGYLRRFEAHLHDGGFQWRDFVNGDVELRLSEMETSIRDVLQHPNYWQPLIDRFVTQVEDVQRIDRRFCGMVAASDQKHAKQIKAYLNKRYPQLNVLIAISDDGEEAHRSLRKFREGRHDILVTVHMAYVGYDHKPITVIAGLTHYRTHGYLRQLYARGLRVVSDIPLEKQALYLIVPDDPNMQNFIEVLRRESEWGYQERQQRMVERESIDIDSSGAQMPLGYVVDAWLTQARAMGLDPTGDLTPEELQDAEQLRRTMGIPYPITDLIAFARMFQGKPQNGSSEQKPFKTYQERMEDARRVLRDECGSCDYALNVEFGGTYKALYRKFSGGIANVTSIEEIDERIETVMRWKAQGYYD